MFWYEKLTALEALEAGRNPIVGDPDRIAKLSFELTGTADALRTQNQRLRAVRSDQFWKGDAATAFDSYKEKLPPLLDKVIDRYVGVGSALAEYHPKVRESQLLATRALQAYATAKGQHEVAQRALQEQQELEQAMQRASLLRQQAMPGQVVAPQVVRPVVVGPQPAQQVADAQQAMQAAIRMMTQAIEERTVAARACASAIDQATHDDLADPVGTRAVSSARLDKLATIAPGLRTLGTQLSTAALAMGSAGSATGVSRDALARAALAVNVTVLLADAALAAAGRLDRTQVLTDAAGVAQLATITHAAGGLRGRRDIAALEQTITDPDLRAALEQARGALAPGARVSDVIRNPLTLSPDALADRAIGFAGQHPSVVRSLTRISLPVR